MFLTERFVKGWNGLLMETLKSPCLEVCERCSDVAFRDRGYWCTWQRKVHSWTGWPLWLFPTKMIPRFCDSEAQCSRKLLGLWCLWSLDPGQHRGHCEKTRALLSMPWTCRQFWSSTCAADLDEGVDLPEKRYFWVVFLLDGAVMWLSSESTECGVRRNRMLSEQRWNRGLELIGGMDRGLWLGTLTSRTWIWVSSARQCWTQALDEVSGFKVQLSFQYVIYS